MAISFTRQQLEAAADLVHATVPPTPQHHWPLLSARAGAEIRVKHENHTPLGAFKVRGGLVYMDNLKRRLPDCPGVVTATRGNHGQSVAFAAARAGMRPVVVVPHGNSVEKNAAMRALGAELVEHGSDFQDAFEHAVALSETEGLHLLPSYHEDLILGVASYGLELFTACPDLDRVYVPIGLGSGISGVISARDALGLRTEVIGVVAENAPAYALSFEQRKPVSTNSADTFADGVACRVPVPAAVELICKGAERIVTVAEAEIRAAMRHYFTDTHNIAEGAGAVPLAGCLKEASANSGKKIGVILTGGNVDREVYQEVLMEADKLKEAAQ